MTEKKPDEEMQKIIKDYLSSNHCTTHEFARRVNNRYKDLLAQHRVERPEGMWYK